MRGEEVERSNVALSIKPVDIEWPLSSSSKYVDGKGVLWVGEEEEGL